MNIVELLSGWPIAGNDKIAKSTHCMSLPYIVSFLEYPEHKDTFLPNWKNADLSIYLRAIAFHRSSV